MVNHGSADSMPPLFGYGKRCRDEHPVRTLGVCWWTGCAVSDVLRSVAGSFSRMLYHRNSWEAVLRNASLPPRSITLQSQSVSIQSRSLSVTACFISNAHEDLFMFLGLLCFHYQFLVLTVDSFGWLFLIEKGFLNVFYLLILCLLYRLQIFFSQTTIVSRFVHGVSLPWSARSSQESL